MALRTLSEKLKELVFPKDCRTDVLKKAASRKGSVRAGGSHLVVLDPNGRMATTIPHSDPKPNTCKAIMKAIDDFDDEIVNDASIGKKKKMESLVSALRDALSEGRPEPEADENDIYGSYLFGMDRPDVDPPESDTPEEWVLKQKLAKWFKGTRDVFTPEVIASLKSLRDSGKYTSVLQVPDGRIYRMLSINYESWRGLTKDQKAQLKKEGTLIVKGGNLSLQRGKLVGSWTINKNMFRDALMAFMSLLSRDKNTLIVCVADAGANRKELLLNPEKTTKIAKGYAWQEEVLQTGKISLIETHYYVIRPVDRTDKYMSEVDAVKKFIRDAQ
jgi:hypothetical protein